MLKHILLVLIIAMTPIMELRAAIPVGVANDLGIWLSILISIIGNIIPVPFIMLFIKKIFEVMKKNKFLGKIVKKMEEKANKNKKTIDKYGYFGLFILVAIPLPGTGAWTGSLVASMFNMDIKKSFITISFGVLGAAFIVSLITYGITIFI